MFQDELVDIVDENMNFVEVVAKKEAHTLGLLHKCVIGQVINSKGEYLLVKHPPNRQDPGLYVCPMGGHVTSGEKDEESVSRELFEELGIKDYRSEFAGAKIFNREVIGRKENHVFLVYKVFSDQEPVLSDEAESCKYFSKEELKKELKEHPENFGKAFHFVVDNILTELK
jgi:isopentenyl-diphosphate delta-isomerase